ncbi:MAG: hypothetical protein EBY62_08025 [Cellvibrionales bacterium]|nr:hypothetical protein [Cellvibrionales bacterium]
MHEVFRHWDTSTVGLVNGLLQDAGIMTVLRNWDACNITEIPIPAIYPNVCVLRKEDSGRAKEIISAFRKSSETTGDPWICHECGEQVESNFLECWQCSTVKG